MFWYSHHFIAENNVEEWCTYRRLLLILLEMMTTKFINEIYIYMIVNNTGVLLFILFLYMQQYHPLLNQFEILN